MDKLTQASLVHGKIYEALAVSDSLMSLSVSVGFIDANKVRSFFNDIILPHFIFEARNIFSVINDFGTKEERDLVAQLTKDHAQMMDAFRLFDKYAAEGMGYKELFAVIDPVLKALLEHARIEDQYLYPNIKKYLAGK